MLKLDKIRIRRFKSIRDASFSLDEKLSLLIGSNGTGKSSILQSMSFIRFFCEGKSEEFFSARAWDVADVQHRNQGSKATVIGFDLILKDDAGQGFFWSFSWGLKTKKAQHESLWRIGDNGDKVELFSFSYKHGLRVLGVSVDNFPIKPPGSILAIMDFAEVNGFDGHEAVSSWASGILSLELINPISMRKRARVSTSDIGPRGELFSGFLASLDLSQRAKVAARLSTFYPISGLATRKKKAGWVVYKVFDAQADLEIDSDHISDGVLRLLALAALPEMGKNISVILIDEIEDGVEPHLLSNLLDMLRSEVDGQLIVTSHSPIVVNQFEPSSVFIVARDDKGCAITQKLSQLELFSSNEAYFGTGEVWLNASLSAIKKQITMAKDQSIGEPTMRSATDVPTASYVNWFASDFLKGEPSL